MKLGTLTIDNIKNYGLVKNIDLAHKVIAIEGDNSAGKTTFLDALRFAITGYNIYGRDLVKKDAGVRYASTVITIDGYGKLERAIGKNKDDVSKVRRNGKLTTDKAVKQEMEDLFRQTYAVINASLTQSFIEWKDDDKRDFFFKEGIINTSYDYAKLISYIDPAVLTPELEAEIQKLFPNTPGKLYDFNHIKVAYNEYYEQRTRLNKRCAELKALLNAELPVGTGRTLKDLQDKKDELNKELGALESKKSEITRNNELRDETEKALKEIGEIEKFPANVSITSTEKEIENIKEDIKKVREQISVLVKSTETAKNMKEMLSGTLEKLGDVIACPLINGLQCTTDMTSSKQKIKDDIESYEAVLKDNKESVDRLNTMIKEKEAVIEELQDRKNRIEKAFLKAKQKEQYMATLRRLPPKQSLEEIKDKINSIKQKVDRLSGLCEKQQAYDAALKERKKNETLFANTEELANMMDVLVGEFSPRGIKTRMLAKVIGTLEDECNNTLSVMSPGYKVRFNVDEENFDIYVTTPKGYEVPMKILSRSEVVRLSTVIQYLISKMQGVNIIIIDNIDSCVSKVLDSFLDTIVKIEEAGDSQIIMVKAGTFDEVAKKPFKDLKRYKIENGDVKAI